MQDSEKKETARPVARMRPRDAAALVLIDRTQGAPKVLMGKRSSRHVFMPETYVFPGGRCDPEDRALPFSADLHPDVLAKLTIGPPARLSASRGRALALAALRELAEETGLATATAPDLSSLRFAVRAITPPGHPRRFDTRFFLTFTDEAGFDPKAMRDSEELHDLRWVDIGGDTNLNIPDVTRWVLQDVGALLSDLSAHGMAAPVPFYRFLHGRTIRSLL